MPVSFYQIRNILQGHQAIYYLLAIDIHRFAIEFKSDVFTVGILKPGRMAKNIRFFYRQVCQYVVYIAGIEFEITLINIILTFIKKICMEF